MDLGVQAQQQQPQAAIAALPVPLQVANIAGQAIAPFPEVGVPDDCDEILGTGNKDENQQFNELQGNCDELLGRSTSDEDEERQREDEDLDDLGDTSRVLHSLVRLNVTEEHQDQPPQSHE